MVRWSFIHWKNEVQVQERQNGNRFVSKLLPQVRVTLSFCSERFAYRYLWFTKLGCLPCFSPETSGEKNRNGLNARTRNTPRSAGFIATRETAQRILRQVAAETTATQRPEAWKRTGHHVNTMRRTAERRSLGFLEGAGEHAPRATAMLKLHVRSLRLSWCNNNIRFVRSVSHPRPPHRLPEGRANAVDKEDSGQVQQHSQGYYGYTLA